MNPNRHTPARGASGPLKRCWASLIILLFGSSLPGAEGDWEITPESQEALARGLDWLAQNQGPEGNWDSKELGLVSMGALAFLSAGHLPAHGKYGKVLERALDYVIRNAAPGGLLNLTGAKRDMYNHGLAAFVLGQAHGRVEDPRIGPVLDRALKLISTTQCDDGGWDYEARRQTHGHDLSLVVMQAKALRSAADSGFEVPSEVIEMAEKSVRAHYRSKAGKDLSEGAPSRGEPGQFTYDGRKATLAMAACGVVCLQEFGEYDDWRIPKNMDVIHAAIMSSRLTTHDGKVPFDAYTLYYVSQAIYQVGGLHWKECYPRLRDALVASQVRDPTDRRHDGRWKDGNRVGGKEGELYGTAVACFVLAIPNRYLPILEQARTDLLRARSADR